MSKQTLIIKDGLESRTHEFRGVKRDIIRAGEFQRLNYINNLGCGYLLYPNAHLKRFSHSIGASYLGGVFAEKLGLNSHDTLMLELALLLHDLGHGPFSHATESVSGSNHEDRTYGLITGELEMPRRHCQGNVPRILKDHSINPEEVASIINGTHPTKILHQLVSGYFDLDKGDYLRRDEYATGAKIGSVDVDRLAHLFVNDYGELKLLEKGIDDMVKFVEARKDMYRNVYRHKRTAVFEAMLKMAVVNSNINLPTLWCMTDDQLLNKLSESTPQAIDIADMFYANIPYEEVRVMRSESMESMLEVKKLQDEKDFDKRLAKYAGMEEDHVLLIYEMPEQKDLPQFPVLTTEGETVNLFKTSQRAHSAETQNLAKFYGIVAVHPSATNQQKEKISSMVEEVLRSRIN